MPDSSTLYDQVELAKTKIDELVSTTLNAQDLVFLAKALESLGNLLGINDLVGITNTAVLDLQNASTGQVALVAAEGAAQIDAVITTGNLQIALVESSVSNFSLYVHMGVL
jgi:hypothetical protein